MMVEWTREYCIKDHLIDDVADRDPRIATFRDAAVADGWVKIWFTPESAWGDGPSIIHWPTFAGDANENDSVFDNWELLVWECGLSDIEYPNTITPHLTLKKKGKEE